MSSLSRLCLESLATSLSQSSLNDDLSPLSVLSGEDADQLIALLASSDKLSKRRVFALCSSHSRRLDLQGNALQAKTLGEIISRADHVETISFSAGALPTPEGLISASWCRPIHSLTCRLHTYAAGWSQASSSLLELDLSETSLADQGLATLAVRCKQLRVLRLCHCVDVSDDGIFAVVANLRQLTELNLAYCREVSEVSLAGLPDGCPELKDLGLAGVGLCQEISLPLPFLVGLNLKGLNCVGNRTIIDSIGPDSRLRYINAAEAHLGDEAVIHLSTRCQESLTHINLSWCEEVTEEGLRHLFASLDHLRVVKLRCMAVSDLVLEALAHKAPGLEELDIGRSEASDIGLKQVAARCPQLKRLACSWCGVSDKGLRTILRSCRSLEDLDLEGCKALTADMAGYIPGELEVIHGLTTSHL